MSRAELAVDVSDEIEIPCAVYDEIVSWQGVLGASVGDSNKTANFRLAAENLLRLGERQHQPVRQHIVDALYRMSVVADIDDAASQEIMADAAEPSRLERPSNVIRFPNRPPTPYPLAVTDWLDRPLPEPDRIMGEFLTTTSRIVLNADTGIGKTSFAQALSGHAAAAIDFLHWRAHRPARVLLSMAKCRGDC
jgi:hypothetical protein